MQFRHTYCIHINAVPVLYYMFTNMLPRHIYILPSYKCKILYMYYVFTNMSICRLHIAVLATIKMNTEVLFFPCFKFELPRTQPCWLALNQERKKNGLAHDVKDTSATHARLVQDVTDSARLMRAPTAMSSRLSNIFSFFFFKNPLYNVKCFPSQWCNIYKSHQGTDSTDTLCQTLTGKCLWVYFLFHS